MNDSITIARNGTELGSWSTQDVQKMLAAGVLTSADYYFQAGKSDWSTLDGFTPSAAPPTAKTFAITFGSAMAVDKLGFVGSGTITIAPESVEIGGPKLWPALARVVVFFIGAPLLWSLMGSIVTILPEGGGAVGEVLRLCFFLITVFVTPLLVLMLIRRFCASPASVPLRKSDIGAVTRSGKRITFTAAAGSRRRLALFQTANQSSAQEVERLLCQRPSITT